MLGERHWTNPDAPNRLPKLRTTLHRSVSALVRSPSAVASPSAVIDQLFQRSDMRFCRSANAVSTSKRPVRRVRDEEAVGSNPATPTRKWLLTALESTAWQFAPAYRVSFLRRIHCYRWHLMAPAPPRGAGRAHRPEHPSLSRRDSVCSRQVHTAAYPSMERNYYARHPD